MCAPQRSSLSATCYRVAEAELQSAEHLRGLSVHSLGLDQHPPEGERLGPPDIRLLAHVTRILSRDYGPKEDEGIAYRGLFIIDGKGDPQITCSDLSDGYSVDEALRLAQALQFTGEHEEVCPAGWVPGSHTVKPSVNHNNGIFL